MSRSCEAIHPLLFRVNEGEATPEQAMLVARHLSDCTACRITGARERRLAEMLSSELDELPVGEDFVDTVMATLPKELPKRKRRTRHKSLRGLKLACLGGLLGLPTLLGGPGLPSDLSLPARVLPQFTAETAPSIPEGAVGVMRIVGAVADALSGGLPLPDVSLVAGVGLLAALALTGLVTVAGASAVFAFAARSLLRFG